jgi:VanZ family protein
LARKTRLDPILWALSGVLALLLFAGGPGTRFPRSLQAAWDMGHVAAFSLWSHLLVRTGPVRDASVRRRWIAVILFCLAAGGAIEGIQKVTGGDASLGDLLRDVVGGIVTVCWFVPRSGGRTGSSSRVATAFAVILLLLAGFPLLAAVTDEAVARSQFPTLSDFETPFESGRWSGNARVSADRSFSSRGRASLRVELDTSPYSGTFLTHFPGDWRGYRFLVVDVLNPSREGIEVTCRIHDERHEEGEQRYEDRFNKGFPLPPGWSEIRIDLREVARAPAGRMMDPGRIRSVGLFATGLRENRTLYIDFVRLE